MNITIDISAAAALLRLEKGARRMGFAVANSLNTTAKAIQREQQEHVARTFILRPATRQFVTRQAAIIRFASYAANRFEAKVSVGERPRLLLSGFETGEERKPFVGRRVAVPVGARPTREASVPAELRIQALRLRRPTVGRRGPRKAGPGPIARRGLLGAFQTAGAVLQRVGKGSVRVLYVFVRPFRLPPVLGFRRRAQAVVRREFERNLLHEIRDVFARHG